MSKGAREQEERRSEPRLEVTHGTVQIDGDIYPLRNWSTRGFLAASYTGDHNEGDTVDVSFSVPFVERMLEFTGQARVIRIDRELRELAGLLVVMTEDWNEAFERYFAGGRAR